MVAVVAIFQKLTLLENKGVGLKLKLSDASLLTDAIRVKKLKDEDDKKNKKLNKKLKR